MAKKKGMLRYSLAMLALIAQSEASESVSHVDAMRGVKQALDHAIVERKKRALRRKP